MKTVLWTVVLATATGMASVAGIDSGQLVAGEKIAVRTAIYQPAESSVTVEPVTWGYGGGYYGGYRGGYYGGYRGGHYGHSHYGHSHYGHSHYRPYYNYGYSSYYRPYYNNYSYYRPYYNNYSYYPRYAYGGYGGYGGYYGSYYRPGFYGGRGYYW